MSITTDRALDILAMSEQARWADGIEPEDVDKAVKTIRKALESDRWTPVSEGLPKQTDDYLVTTAFDIGAKEPVRERYVRRFYATSGKWSGLCDGEEVVAWRPLPEPYEPQESEE